MSDGETILTDVTIVQGTLRIQSAQAVLTRKNDAITRLLLTGAPAKLQQENDNGTLVKVRALTIDYAPATEIVVLAGEVEVEQDGNTMRSAKLTYNTKTGQLTADGGSGDGRVRMTIPPKPADKP